MEKKQEAEKLESQGIASLIHIVNCIRHDTLRKQLRVLDHRKGTAMRELQSMEKSISHVIETNRGGAKGVHGFIGERAQVGISNARDLMDGLAPQYHLVDDNGMVDYFRGTIPIQQKACISDKALGLTHVAAHSDMYPEFITVESGIYQIPRDFYDEYATLRDMPQTMAGKLPKADWRLWKKIQTFSANHTEITVEPMVVDYAEIQANAIGETITKERVSLLNLDKMRRADAITRGKASLAEAAKVTAFSAALEGVVDGGMSAIEHVQDGRSLADLDSEDWKEIGKDTLLGVGKGALHGGAVYAITNCTKVSAPAAGAIVSVAISTVEATSEYANGSISGGEYAEKLAENCLDAAVCALFAKTGEQIIKIPVVGSLTGSAVGMVVCFFLKNSAKKMLVKAA